MRTRRFGALALLGALLAGCEPPQRDGTPAGDLHEDLAAVPSQLMLIRRAAVTAAGPGHVLVETMVVEGFTRPELHRALLELGEQELAREDVVAARMIIFAAVADRPGQADLVPIAFGVAAPATGWGAPAPPGTPHRVHVHFGNEPPW